MEFIKPIIQAAREVSRWYWVAMLLPLSFIVLGFALGELMLIILGVATDACLYYMARLHLHMKREVREDAKDKGL